ncbi:ribonucleoside-diphosphate reductase, adenosylcobalamin-dependent [Candidatus Woesearchaeota archaeon CG10_big_fil_rev_8_21_14_0_10_37_12]|nr:MAG: ribonucleoside-diphosphate reductase, adenosylcobalamin-dependent [Candidatus Woesearchaeota archaeon CG10_big_fil_rev_8_21_14_0_10_37_12]
MTKIPYIQKRDGSLEPFKEEKIKASIEQAIKTTGKKINTAKILQKIFSDLEKQFTTITPTTQYIHDIIKENLDNFAKEASKKYQQHKKEKHIIEFRTTLGIRDELHLSQNSIAVLKSRYLLRDENGNITETPIRLFRRVAKAIAQADSLYKKGALKKTEEEFFNILSNLDFLPNTPTLMNAGTDLGQLSACFVLPVGDSLDEIFDSIKLAAIIQQSGGGTGFSFSQIRPQGDLVKSTKGAASGPVSFMRIFDTTTDIIKQGSKRRGANMGILHCTHPDILKFIVAKRTGNFVNFNLSIAVTEQFMQAVLKNQQYHLVNPRTNKKTNQVNASTVFDIIAENAWKTGDPGIIFIDEINKTNPTNHIGLIDSTNPCGEQPLHPYESCNLGSINLAHMLKQNKFDWDKFKKIIHTAIHFLDNVIDVNKYPDQKIEEITKANRRIGLGIMGFAELLIKLNLPYDSDKALQFAEKLMKFINEEARKESNKLAEERGSFPNIAKSTWKQPTRNATVTTIAPTGTISIIANATSGIEPLFAISYARTFQNTQLLEINKTFEEIARAHGFYSVDIMTKIAKTGSVQGLKEVPKDIQKIFKTAHEIKPDWHVKMQAVFQKYCDNAVSKTINLPENATIDDIKKAYLLAHKLKCKGITIYRYTSKKEQILQKGIVSVPSEYSGGKCEECSY